jgi:hypothetical protein
MLGNLTVEEMERRLGITLSDEHRRRFLDSRQEQVNDTPLAPGCWHCFDIPFMLVCDVKETAMYFHDIIRQYTIASGVTFQIAWER